MVTLPDGVMLEMTWKQIKYTNCNNYIIFQIIPMMTEMDIILIPRKEQWNKIENIFSLEEREEIIFLIERIAWKRKIKIVETDVEPVVNRLFNITNGMIESTNGYKTLTKENLFDPSSKLDDNQVKKLYCKLEEKYARGIQGKITIPQNIILPDSVTQWIVQDILIPNKQLEILYT